MVPVTEVERRKPHPTKFTEWCSLICRVSVVKRGLKFCFGTCQRQWDTLRD